MNKLAITTDSPKISYLPGTHISGKITWDLSESTEFLTLQMFWYTAGKGTRDFAVVDELKIDSPFVSGEENFSFRIPSQPLSFSGTLISLLWALELKTAKETDAEQFHFTVSHTGPEISLTPVFDPDKPLLKKFNH